MSTVPSIRSTAGLARWAALGGILYVVLFVIGTILLFDGTPDGDASPAKVVAYYSDSGHRDKISIGWIVSGLINTGIRTMSDDTYRDEVFPGLIHAANDASYVLHATGGAGASAMIIAASLAAMRAGAVRPWVGWLGIVAGILALASIAFFPQAAIGIWILVVSGAMFFRGGSSRSAELAQ
jgi:hypothetical protein